MRKIVAVIIGFSLVIQNTAHGGRSELCRPTMAEAMSRAKKRCVVWGNCKLTIDEAAAVIAERPDRSLKEILQETEKNTGRDKFERSGAILLMAELGLLDLK